MYTFSIILALYLLVPACGPKPIPPESPLDTAPNHYQRGMEKIDQGDLWGALQEFERAGALDPKYPGVQVGTALVAMEQGDFWKARQAVEKAIHQDGDFIDAHIAAGRIISREGISREEPPEKWLSPALRAFDQAQKKDPANPAVHFFKGQALFAGFQFPEARDAFSRVIEINRGNWVAAAMAKMRTIQMIERAAPGSKVGKKIALVPQITRAELGVLLIEELRLPELVEKRGALPESTTFRSPQGAATTAETGSADIEGSWARPWIEEILALGVSGLERFPDGSFQPDLPITRADYAMVNQGLLIMLSGDSALATRYIGETSRFPDVRGDFYAYNAIALSTERGIMEAERRSGAFRPGDPVSGSEALLMMRELQNAFRMEF